MKKALIEFCAGARVETPGTTIARWRRPKAI